MSKILKTGRIPNPPLRFTFEYWAEVTETEKEEGGKTIEVALKLVSNDEQQFEHDKNARLSFNLSDGRELFLYTTLNKAFKRVAETLPGHLAKQFASALSEGLQAALRDSDYFPPRRKGDWSQEKLFQAVLKAVAAVPKYSNPTLKKVAEILTRRYSLNPPLTADALRMLLKRYELEWKRLKKQGIKRTEKA